MSDEMTELSVVVPVHNEAALIARFVAELRRVVPEAEILFVDDGSTDGTWAAVRALIVTDRMIGAVRLSRNFGKEAAVWAGMEIARGEAVVVMDADFQHPPDIIPKMLELWRTGRWQIVEARKVSRARGPWWYGLLSAVFYWILRMGTRLDLRGSTDFKLLDRKVVEVLKTLPERVTFFRGITSWTGVDRTAIDFDVPEAGRPTRWSLVRLIRFSVDAITSFTPWPLFLVAFAGAIFTIFSIILGIQTLYMYFFGGAVTGFTTVILLTLIVGAVNMFGIAVLGLYVSRLFDEVKGRPRSIVIEKLPPA